MTLRELQDLHRLNTTILASPYVQISHLDYVYLTPISS